MALWCRPFVVQFFFFLLLLHLLLVPIGLVPHLFLSRAGCGRFPPSARLCGAGETTTLTMRLLTASRAIARPTTASELP